jgi:hypothetical protein
MKRKMSNGIVSTFSSGSGSGGFGFTGPLLTSLSVSLEKQGISPPEWLQPEELYILVSLEKFLSTLLSCKISRFELFLTVAQRSFLCELYIFLERNREEKVG